VRGRALGLLLLLLGACIESRTTTCGDRVCPPSQVCVAALDRCVFAQQVEECLGKSDGDACSLAGAPGTCVGGVCISTCGDGFVIPPEQCDGANLRGARCEDLGYYGGALACASTCEFDTSGCVGRCGDGVVDFDRQEQCDGAPPPGLSCLDFGYDAGPLGCRDALCTPDFSQCRHIGWRSLGLPPFVPEMSAAWGSSADDFYVVGDAGAIQHFYNRAWQSEPSGTTRWLRKVWGSGPSDVFAVGDVGAIVHRDATAWSPMTSGTSEALSGVWGTGPNHVIAVGGKGTILRYDGAAWSPVASGTSQGLFDVWGSGPDNVFAVDVNGGVIRYGGTSWAPQVAGDGNSLHAVWGSGPGDVFAVGINKILRYDGNAWTPQSFPTPTTFWGVWGSGPSDVYAAASAMILRYDGSRWSLASTQAEAFQTFWGHGGQTFAVSNDAVLGHRGSFWSIVPVAATSALWVAGRALAFAVGYDGIQRFDGATWSTMTSPAITFNAVWGSAPNHVVAVTNGSSVIRYNGSAWSAPVTLPTSPRSANAVWGSGPDDVFVGTGGGIVHWDGVAWTIQVNGVFEALWGSGPADVWASGRFGALLHYDGAAWSPRASGTDQTLNGLWGLSPNLVFAVGGRGVILRYDGTAWSPLTSGTQRRLNAVWGTAPDDVFAAGDRTILHFDGARWSPVRSPEPDANFTAVGGAGDWVLFLGGTQSLRLVRTQGARF
jgi:hypothetical protein